MVYVDIFGLDTSELATELIRLTTEKGATPYWNLMDDQFAKSFFSRASEAQNRQFAEFHKKIMERIDAYVSVRGAKNPYELGDMPPEQTMMRETFWMNEVHMKTRLKKRWVVLRYPNNAMAQMSKKSVAAFEDFYFRVCNLDYSKMSRAMDGLVSLMQKTDRVRIVSPGTDIEFSIKGMPAIKCDGKVNIPDGEVYTAPVKDSINGVITYNTSSFFRGTLFDKIRLEVKQGKIVKATSPQNQAELDRVFESDPGARYFGEFALGVNPYILEPMNDTLFDEKIKGSIHLTPGNSYDDCDNGNKSSVHWDLVLIQRETHGGGELYFDGKLIRKNGEFTHEQLLGLNSDFK
jgi:aminopeptidase